MKRIYSILFFVLIIPVIYAGLAIAAEPKLVEKNISLGKVYADWEMYVPSLRISPDSTRMAFMARKGNKFAIIENGQISPTFDSIGKDTPIFSKDSKHVAYIAKKGAKWLIVHDGKEGERYDAVFVPVVSPDSKRMAYVAKEGDHQFVVVDGKKEKAYDYIVQKLNSPAFSPDSAHVAYVAMNGKKMFMRTA